MSDKIKVAIIGCGRISKNHFNAIIHHKDAFELVAVCDVHQKTLDAIGQTYQIEVDKYQSYEQLLKKSDAEVVILCTPSGLHAEQACLAAEHGKHVVTEKPMATRWHDGMRMVRACDKAGVHLFVVKQNRRNPTIQAVKKAVSEGRFGRINLVHSNVFWTRPQAYYDQAKWRGTWEFDGGAFMNQASHYVDLLEWLIGPVASVQAMTATLARDIEVEDTGVVNFRYRTGALGSMSVTMLTYPKNIEGSIAILGEKGTVRLGGVAVNEVQHWEFEDGNDSLEDMQKLNYSLANIYGNGHINYYDNVIKTLRGEEEAETDGREGLRSLEVLVATYLSARDGGIVHLPLEL